MCRRVVLVGRTDSEVGFLDSVCREVDFIVLKVVEANASIVSAVASDRVRVDLNLLEIVVFLLFGRGGTRLGVFTRLIIGGFFLLLSVHNLAPSLDIVESHVFFLRIVYLSVYAEFDFIYRYVGRTLFERTYALCRALLAPDEPAWQARPYSS